MEKQEPIDSFWAPVSWNTPRCRPVLFALAILITMVSGSASALQPRRGDQENSLTRAFYAAGSLWLLSDAGELSSIREGSGNRIEETLPEPVLDLCIQDGHPVVITCPREHCLNWTERRRIDRTWRVENTIQTQGDDLIGLGCTSERITLLTSRRLIDSRKEKQTSVVLSDELSPDLLVSMLDAPDRVLVGANEGEWGGGLWSIDWHTGKVTPIERYATSSPCGGPLNSHCDPVNGIAFEPWKPECVAATIGLVHFTARGSIVEVCGDEIHRLYYKPVKKPMFGLKIGEGGEPSETVAFFGLTREGDALWAAGTDGIYRIDAKGVTRYAPLPKFQRIGGVDVSFELPNFVLVLTSIAARRSVSSALPLIVSR